MKYYFRDSDKNLRAVEDEEGVILFHQQVYAARQIFDLTGIRAEKPILYVVDNRPEQSEPQVA